MLQRRITAQSCRELEVERNKAFIRKMETEHADALLDINHRIAQSIEHFNKYCSVDVKNIEASYNIKSDNTNVIEKYYSLIGFITTMVNNVLTLYWFYKEEENE